MKLFEIPEVSSNWYALIQWLLGSLKLTRPVPSYKLDDKQHIDYLIMISPLCLSQFKSAPDVLLLDCTFKTNKYGMPLLNLVGSNGNNWTIHLGVVLMRHHDKAAFKWVFNHLKDKFNAEGIAIQLFISDNDLGYINALNSVFNNPKITICRWHINKNVLTYL